MCGGSLWGSFLRFSLALLLSASAIPLASAQTPLSSPPQSYDWPTLSPEPTPPTPELMQRWSEYDRQFKSSMLSLDQFLDQVEAFGISFESLPGFMTHLADSLKESEEARINEREQGRTVLGAALGRAARAERSRDRWRAGAAAAATLALLEAVTLLLTGP